MAARSLFFTGKGGVGKSTCAALTALARAGEGRRVLLLSLDPAHNQSDLFERSFTEKPLEVRSGLMVSEPDTDRWIQRYLREVEQRVQASYQYLTALNLEHHFRVFRHAPGLEEFALRRIYEHMRAKHEEVDLLVVDMPPTALATRFFASPSISLAWTRQLLTLRTEIRKRREMITRIKMGSKEIEQDRVLRVLEEETARNEALKELFADPGRCAVQLVINPDPLSWNEGIRIRGELDAIGIPLARVIVNKSGMGDADARREDADARWQADTAGSGDADARREDSQAPAELRDLPRLHIPSAAKPPVGLDALLRLLARLDPSNLPE